MAVTLLNTFIRSTINGTAMTLTVGTTNAAGDVCVAFWTHTRGTLTAQLASSAGTAYTEIGVVTNGNVSMEAGYRVFTSSETTVTSCGTGNAQDAAILMAAVLRNVSSTPLIIQSNSTTATSSNPNSPAVPVPWANSAVLTAAGILANTTLTAPTGFGTTVSCGATDTRSCAGGLAFKSTNASLENPSSWTGGASAAWVAFTVTLGSTEAPALTYPPLSTPTAHLVERGLSAAWTQYHSGFTVPSSAPAEVIIPNVCYPSIVWGSQGMIGY